MPEGIGELIEQCARSLRPGLGRQVLFDTHPYGDEGRRAMPPSISLMHARELFDRLPFRFELKEITDPLVTHLTTSLRIWDVPRRYRMGTMCFGKGASLDHALASAACEAVERVTTWPRDGEVFFNASAREIDDRRIARLDPRRAPLPRTGPTGFVPYDEATPLNWVPAWCLMHDAPLLVPRTLSHLLEVDDTAELFIDNRPNGSASGNTLGEAILHALYELIERDAFCLFTYHALPAPLIDPASLTPRSAAVYAQFVDAGLEVRLRDYTSDLGVPVVHAYAYDRRGGTARGPVHAWGGGCHLDARLAAERAVFELVQEHAISARDIANGVQPPPDSSEEVRNDRRRYFPGVEGWFSHLDRVGGRRSQHGFEPAPDNPAGELASLLTRLRRAGIERVAAVDLTTYDSRLPVVRVAAPDLLFIPWVAAAGEPPRRLLEAPARMGHVFGRDYGVEPGVPPQSFIV